MTQPGVEERGEVPGNAADRSRRKMVVLCPYPENCAPSQRLKFEQYYESWRASGWDIDVRPFWDVKAWTILHRRGHTLAKVIALLRGLRRRTADVAAACRADLAYVHLEVLPLGPPVFELRLLKSGVPVVFDIDDMVHLPHSSAGNTFMRWLRGPARVLTLLKGATEVIVCTPFLYEWAREHARHVTDISSTIETRTYSVRRHHKETPAGVVIGWSGSHSTAPYLHALAGVLRDLTESDGIRLRVIGDPGFGMDGVEVEALPWRLETEVEDLAGIDIGVYPLPHEDWVLGKSGLKALQYMGVGVPVVAERFGTNERLFEDGVEGFLAHGDEEWAERLRSLVRDAKLRAEMGTRGRALVETKYSVIANEPLYLSVIQRAIERRADDDL